MKTIDRYLTHYTTLMWIASIAWVWIGMAIGMRISDAIVTDSALTVALGLSMLMGVLTLGYLILEQQEPHHKGWILCMVSAICWGFVFGVFSGRLLEAIPYAAPLPLSNVAGIFFGGTALSATLTALLLELYERKREIAALAELGRT